MGSPCRSLLQAVLVLLAVQQAFAQAQDMNNGQGKILWAMAKWLSGSDSAAALAAMGWTDGGNPCNGWGGVSCNSQGYVTNLNLAGKGLTGSIPSDPGLWAGMTALTSMDLANNQLSGSVPAAIKSAPLLNNVNLGDNKAMCGYLPTGLPANTGGTGIGVECGAATPSPSPPPTPSPSPPPATSAEVPAVTNTSTADAANKSSAAPSPAATTPAAVPPAPQAVISGAPICSCALRGFGSQDCAGALAKECKAANPPEVCASRAAVLNDTTAATAMGQYLADACFKGQNMDTSICTCVQNLLGNDCAKARVSLCIKGDPLCLPIQNAIGEGDSATAGEAAQQVATAFDGQCSVTEPTQPGVKATMEFPDTSMGQYISKQYTQNVANALSSVTNVPTSSISTLDVRPFTGAARSTAAPKRLLLQAAAGGNGVQATYFLATEDPAGVSQRLSTAANDGTLSARLAQYGISAQAGGLRVQNYLQLPSPAPKSGSSSFPLWALAPIIVGTVLLLGLVGFLLWCCCLRKRGRKAVEYAPPPAKKQTSIKKVSPGRSVDDVVVARDLSEKDYDGSAPSGYAVAASGTVAGSYKPAGFNNYKAAAAPPTMFTSPPSPKSPKAYSPAGYDLPANGNSKFSNKGPSYGAGAAVGAAAAGATAGTAAGMKRSGSNRAPRADSPTASRGSANSLGAISPEAASPAASAPAGPAHLSNLQSMKARDYQEPVTRTGSGGANNNTLTPWEATSSRPGTAVMQPKASAASSGVTGSSLTSARSAGIASAGVGAAAAGAGALSGTRSGPLGPGGLRDSGDGQGNGSWKSNVRPASGPMAGPGVAGSSTMMSNPSAAKTSQQAERAKFWAQFQDTWQQVRQTQNVDNEPGSPSSGTNWTDITDARTARH